MRQTFANAITDNCRC